MNEYDNGGGYNNNRGNGYNNNNGHNNNNNGGNGNRPNWMVYLLSGLAVLMMVILFSNLFFSSDSGKR